MSLQYGKQGLDTEDWCDLDLGMAIYRKLKEQYPEDSDENLAKYFSNALYCMRTKDTSEDRKAGRVKRLGLKPDFDKWNFEYENTDE